MIFKNTNKKDIGYFISYIKYKNNTTLWSKSENGLVNPKFLYFNDYKDITAEYIDGKFYLYMVEDWGTIRQLGMNKKYTNCIKIIKCYRNNKVKEMLNHDENILKIINGDLIKVKEV